jgi:hypothetical protein
MPTFLIFRGGSVINTIRGADRGALTTAVEAAVKLTPGIAKPVYSTPGRTLGGPVMRPGQSLNRSWITAIKTWIDAILSVLGLYLWSLFSVSVSWIAVFGWR